MNTNNDGCYFKNQIKVPVMKTSQPKQIEEANL